MGEIKTVKSHPVEGPYSNTRYTAKVKQGKNNTFTWTETAEEYDYNDGLHVYDLYNMPNGAKPSVGKVTKITK